MKEQNEQKGKTVETKKQKREKYKPRSPRYPCISLREAVKNARALSEKEGRAFVAKEVAVNVWGYNKLHGRSLTILASMAQYGLINYQTGNVGISEDAFTIINAPRNSPERKAALEKCSKLPAIFDELYQNYPDNLPSDESLKWTLKQRGFTEEGAQITINCLRDTNMFITEELKDYTGGNGVTEVIGVKKEKQEFRGLPLIPQKPQYDSPKGNFVLSFTLPTGKNVTLTISGCKLTSLEIGFAKQLLNNHLEIYEKNLPKEEPKEEATS